jgi:hypothetical protein
MDKTCRARTVDLDHTARPSGPPLFYVFALVAVTISHFFEEAIDVIVIRPHLTKYLEPSVLTYSSEDVTALRLAVLRELSTNGCAF